MHFQVHSRVARPTTTARFYDSTRVGRRPGAPRRGLGADDGKCIRKCTRECHALGLYNKIYRFLFRDYALGISCFFVHLTIVRKRFLKATSHNPRLMKFFIFTLMIFKKYKQIEHFLNGLRYLQMKETSSRFNQCNLHGLKPKLRRFANFSANVLPLYYLVDVEYCSVV